MSDGTTLACPNCDRADRLEKRNGRFGKARGWYCYICQQLVDPVERESRGGGVKRGLAKTLMDADADAVGNDQS